jgi:hypothetical protein
MIETCQRVRVYDIASRITPCIRVIVILEQKVASGSCSPSHAQVSLGDENQVSMKRSLRVDLPAPYHRSFETIVWAEFQKCGGGAEQLGYRCRCKYLIRIALIDCPTAFAINDE